MTGGLRPDLPTEVPLLCTEGLAYGADKGWARFVFTVRSQLSVGCGIEIENTRIPRQPQCNVTELGPCDVECLLFCSVLGCCYFVILPPTPIPRDRICLYSPGSPPASQQVSLQLRDAPASAHQRQGLKLCATTPWQVTSDLCLF